MKIYGKPEPIPQVKSAPPHKTAGGKTALPKIGKSLRPKDKAALSGEKEEKSARKLGIVGDLQNRCKSEPEKWTVLCFFAGDCNLEPEMTGDLIDLLKAGSSKEMTILAQIDRGENPTLKLGGKPGMTRYAVGKASEPNRPRCREVEHFGQANSSDPKYLKNFLSWGMKNYPAQNYLVLVSGHGSGLQMLPDFSVPKSGHQVMGIEEFNDAVKAAEKEAGVDKSQVLLGLDCCQLSQAEDAYQFKDSASMMLASQAPITNADWQMDKIFGNRQVGTLNLEEMAEHIFTRNEKSCQANSLLDLKAAPRLGEALKRFTRAAGKSRVKPAKLKAIIEAQTRSLNQEENGEKVGYYFSDLQQIASLVLKDREIKDPELKNAARGLQKALSETVVKSSPPRELTSLKNYQGLGIFINSDPKTHQEQGYEGLELSRDTGWGKFLTDYAPEVTEREVLEQIPAKKLSHLLLKPVAQAARKDLAQMRSGKLSPRKWLAGFDRHTDRLEMEDRSFEAVAHPLKVTLNQRVFGPIFHSPLPNQPHWEAGLTVLSALEGEISDKTLAEAARGLLKLQKTVPYRENRDYRELLLNTGAGLMLDLGKAADNRKIAYLEGVYPAQAEKMLQALSRLDKGEKR